MGYYISQMESEFEMKKENADKALEALKNLLQEKKQIGWSRYEKVKNCKTLEDAMNECLWTLDTNDNGDYDDILFEGEKSGSDEVILSAIAPFVENNSYIQMMGEDGEIWRWIFVNGELMEKYATITFE